MAHAASSLCENVDLTIETFDGCGIPVLIGHPVSGKKHSPKSCAECIWGQHFCQQWVLLYSVTKGTSSVQCLEYTIHTTGKSNQTKGSNHLTISTSKTMFPLTL